MYRTNVAGTVSFLTDQVLNKSDPDPGAGDPKIPNPTGLGSGSAPLYRTIKNKLVDKFSRSKQLHCETRLHH